jgi:hypothetical protein
VILHRHHRAARRRPFQDGRVHHGVDVDHVGREGGGDILQRRRVRRVAGVEAGHDLDRAGQLDAALVASHGQTDLVALLVLRADHAHEVPVRAAPVGEAVAEVQDLQGMRQLRPCFSL